MRSLRRRAVLKGGIVVGLGSIAGCTDSSEPDSGTKAWDGSDPAVVANWLPETTIGFVHTDYTARPGRDEQREIASELGISTRSVESSTVRFRARQETARILVGEFEPDSILETIDAQNTADRGSYRGFETLVSGNTTVVGVNESVLLVDNGGIEPTVETYHGDERNVLEGESSASALLSAAGSAPVTRWIDLVSYEEHLFDGIDTIDPTQAALAGDEGESGVLASHLDGEPDDKAIAAIEAELDVDHRGTNGDIVTFDVPDSGELRLSESDGDRVVAPQVQFDVDETEGKVTFTHAGGDAIDDPGKTLTLAGPVKPLGSGSSRLDTGEDAELVAGDAVIGELESDATGGDEIRLVWSPSESSERTTLATYTLASQ